MRLPGLVFGLLGLLFFSGAPLVAASFSCSRASTPQEKAICSDAKLSALDDQVAAAYKTLRAQLSPEGAMKVQADQREWLAWLRLTCLDRDPNSQGREITSCLQDSYQERLHMLKDGLQRVGGMVFFPRLKVLMIPDEPVAESGDPGFGVGRFTWPEIDRPTPQQAAWNAAVRAKVVQMSMETEEAGQAPKDFVPKSVAGSNVSVNYVLESANEKLIAVNLGNSTYNYGAAHPNEYTASFLWWLELQRPLKAFDVFRPGSGWEVFLSERSYEKLRKSDSADALYEEDEVRKGASDAVIDPENWNLSQQKWEIDFPEYSVAARPAGTPSAEFSWTELQPYLTSGFDPTSLPKSLNSPRI